jgi:histidinol phosphatase-like enzyme (inositol monophosphatase family)
MRQLAAESGALIRGYFFDPELSVDEKSDQSPVTVADRGAEQLLRERIHARYPEHGIIGEEFGNEREGAEYVWVLDPIDGTKSFMSGVPLFGTLVALLRGGEPVLGMIHQPILNQLVLGDGQVATLNGKAITVRSTADLEHATLLHTDRRDIARHHDIEAFARLEARVRLCRTWGDCYGYLLLAAGFADVMLDAVMNAWDLLALVPIVRGAGGRITDWHGEAPNLRTNSIVAATPALHGEVIAVLNSSKRRVSTP